MPLCIVWIENSRKPIFKKSLEMEGWRANYSIHIVSLTCFKFCFEHNTKLETRQRNPIKTVKLTCFKFRDGRNICFYRVSLTFQVSVALLTFSTFNALYIYCAKKVQENGEETFQIVSRRNWGISTNYTLWVG